MSHEWPEDGLWWSASTGTLCLADVGKLQQKYEAIISEAVA